MLTPNTFFGWGSGGASNILKIAKILQIMIVSKYLLLPLYILPMVFAI
jgi:hypothetical protein